MRMHLAVGLFSIERICPFEDVLVNENLVRSGRPSK